MFLEKEHKEKLNKMRPAIAGLPKSWKETLGIGFLMLGTIGLAYIMQGGIKKDNLIEKADKIIERSNGFSYEDKIGYFDSNKDGRYDRIIVRGQANTDHGGFPINDDVNSEHPRFKNYMRILKDYEESQSTNKTIKKNELQRFYDSFEGEMPTH